MAETSSRKCDVTANYKFDVELIEKEMADTKLDRIAAKSVGEIEYS